MEKIDETVLELFMKQIIEEFGEVQLELTRYHEYLRMIKNEKYQIPKRVLLTSRFREILNSYYPYKKDIMSFLNVPDSYIKCDEILSDIEDSWSEYQSLIIALINEEITQKVK